MMRIGVNWFGLLVILLQLGCRAHAANSSSVQDAAAAPTPAPTSVPGDACYFHWAGVSANAALLGVGGYTGPSPHEADLGGPAEASVTPQVMDSAFQHSDPSDMGGPGLYVSSDPGDSGVYGADLLVFRGHPSDGKAFTVPVDQAIRQKVKDAMATGTLDQISPMTLYIPPVTLDRAGWYVISRAPGARDPFTLTFGPPTSTDLDCAWTQMSSGFDRPRILRKIAMVASLLRSQDLSNAPVKTRAAGSQAFLTLLLSGSAYSYLQSLDHATDLSSTEVTFLKAIDQGFRAVLPGDARTEDIDAWTQMYP